MQKLHDKLMTVDWNVLDSINDVNARYDTFVQIFESAYNECLPVKVIKVQIQNNRYKPWITNGIKKSTKQREKLYKSWLVSRSEDAKMKHRSYRNKLTHIIRCAKNKYYLNRFTAVKDDLRKTWKLINNVISDKNSNAGEISNIKVNGKLTADMACIVNKFNECFSNVGPNLAKQMDPCNGSFADTISQNYSINQCMFVSPTDESEIIDIVCDIKANKSAGYDSFSPQVIKSVIKAIAQPLTSICNLSIQMGSFPDQMKIAKVCPIFKTDDRCEISNYRPISVLPVFSKILEKLLYKRLLSFLNMHNILVPNQFRFHAKRYFYGAFRSC